MSLIARHKKPGGFKKLVNSLEVTPHDKRTKILNMMRAEDESFVSEVEKYIFEFDEFKNVPDMVLTDVICNMKNEMKSVVFALHNVQDEQLLVKFKKCMPAVVATLYRNEAELWNKVTVGEQKAARFRMIQKARDLQDQGLIVLKKYSPDYGNI